MLTAADLNTPIDDRQPTFREEANGLRIGKALLLKYALLERFDRVVVLDVDTALQDNRSVIVFVVDEVHRTAADLGSVAEHRLMDVALRALIHASVLQSDLCVVPSRHARDLFPEEQRAKVQVQPEGFEVPPLARDKGALRRALGIAAPGPVIGFAGRTLEAVRGFDVFVRMAKAISRVRRDARFLVVGDEATLYGNETTYLNGTSFKQHVVERERLDPEAFIFRPFMPRDRFLQHLQAMDLAVFPIFEGAANWSVFEAMAAGVPVLASDRCFLPEVVTPRHDGFLFDPDDVDALARLTLRVLRQPRALEALGRRGRRTIAARFSVQRAVDGYARIIGEAA